MAVDVTETTTSPGTFAEPDAAHSPAAYWFWHHLPDKDQIRAQVAAMRDGGYRSFQIQARLAYPMDAFLGNDYLEACASAVAEASRLGMTVGIYDDYNWQSGHAAGRTVAGHDHLRERHAFWVTETVLPGTTTTVTIDRIVSATESLGAAGMAWQYDEGRVRWDEWTVVAALVHPQHLDSAQDGVFDVTQTARVVDRDDESCTVRIGIPPEVDDVPVAATVFVSARAASSRLPNYLLREAAERFVEVAYEPCYRTLGPYFGNTVSYVFFDQPHATFYDWAQRAGNLRSSFLHTPELAERFERDHGRAFSSALLALVHDVGQETAALRADFYSTYSRLAQESFLGVLSAWCRSHGVALSGHEVLGHVGSWHPAKMFATWDLRVNFGLDHFGVDAYRDLTGVDAQDCVPQLSAKMGDSVARSNGRSGCIVEQYCLGRWPESYPGDWDLTLEDVRAQAIRLHLAGARQFLFHAFYQTDGTGENADYFVNPRFDFAPGINFQPWWAFHRDFAEESARLSTFIDEAEPACDIAVLYPLRTAWSEGPGHTYGDHVEFWASRLAEAGVGHHFIDESDIEASTVSDSHLCIGSRRYPCVVLPSIATVRSTDTLAALARFSASGGTLVASGDTPRNVQHGAPGFVGAQWAELARSPTVHEYAGLPTAEDLHEILAPLLSRRPHVASGARVWQWWGVDDAGWRLAVFNDGDEPAPVVVTTPWQALDGQHWDLASGEVGPWTGVRDAIDGDAALVLQPMEVLCLHVSESPAPAGDPPSRPRAPMTVTARQRRDIVLDAGWTLEVFEGGRAAPPRPVTPSVGWEQQGLPTYSGLGVYRCRISVPPDDPLDWSLVLPTVHAAVEVRLNGETLGRRAWAPYVFALPPALVKDADNDLELRVYSSAGNKYLAGTGFQEHPAASGLAAVPVLRPLGRRSPASG